MPFGLNRRLEKTGTNLFKSEGILQAALIGCTITSHLNGNFTWETEELWKKWIICFDSNACNRNLQETAKGQEKFWSFISHSCAHSCVQLTILYTWESFGPRAYVCWNVVPYALHYMLSYKLSEIHDPQRNHTWAFSRFCYLTRPTSSHTCAHCRVQMINAYFCLSHCSQK